MNDPINRQDAINAMMALQAEDDEAYGCHIPEGFDGERAKEALKQLPSAQQWIPVSERLPEKKTEVIYSLENHYVSTGYMTDRDYEGNIVELHWEDLESGVLIYPEAWMPLPEPYHGGDEE